MIFAATRGHLTDIPTPRLQEWAGSFLSFLYAKHPEIPAAIVGTKTLSDDTAKALAEVIGEFNKSF